MYKYIFKKLYFNVIVNNMQLSVQKQNVQFSWVYSFKISTVSISGSYMLKYFHFLSKFLFHFKQNHI